MTTTEEEEVTDGKIEFKIALLCFFQKIYIIFRSKTNDCIEISTPIAASSID